MWRGGLQYQLNLFREVKRNIPDKLQCVLLTGEDTDEEVLEALSHHLVETPIKTRLLDIQKTKTGQFSSILFGASRSLNEFFAQHCVDVVFENAFHWGRGIVPGALAWFPDFQHRRLPRMFSRFRWLKREVGFRLQIRTGRQIIVSSYDAANDLMRFYGVSQGRFSVVRFAVPFNRPPSAHSMEATKRKYGISDFFILLPNQFYSHKNHLLVVNAVAELVKRGASTTVVMTGNPLGVSGTSVFDEVKVAIEKNALERNVMLLGSIPYDDLQHLFHSCSAVLNPSRFEGWSTSVEEAKANGIQLLLSDIPVHREQAPSAIFFDQNSPCSLTNVLFDFRRRAMESEFPIVDESGLERDADKRIQDFVNAFYSACVASLKYKV